MVFSLASCGVLVSLVIGSALALPNTPQSLVTSATSGRVVLEPGKIISIPLGGTVLVLGNMLQDSASPGEPRTDKGAVAECENDRSGDYNTISGLAPNAVYPLTRNYASAGECPVTTFYGGVTYVEFSTVGTNWGELRLTDISGGELYVSCWQSGAATGAGALNQWAGTVAGAPTNCFYRITGPPPSLFTQWYGTLHNWHLQTGTVHAAAR